MKIKFHETMEHPIFAFSIKDRKGTEITGTNTALEDYTKDVVEAGKTVTVCFDQIMPLQSGQYLMCDGRPGTFCRTGEKDRICDV